MEEKAVPYTLSRTRRQGANRTVLRSRKPSQEHHLPAALLSTYFPVRPVIDLHLFDCRHPPTRYFRKLFQFCLLLSEEMAIQQVQYRFHGEKFGLHAWLWPIRQCGLQLSAPTFPRSSCILPVESMDDNQRCFAQSSQHGILELAVSHGHPQEQLYPQEAKKWIQRPPGRPQSKRQVS